MMMISRPASLTLALILAVALTSACDPEGTGAGGTGGKPGATRFGPGYQREYPGITIQRARYESRLGKGQECHVEVWGKREVIFRHDWVGDHESPMEMEIDLRSKKIVVLTSEGDCKWTKVKGPGEPRMRRPLNDPPQKRRP